ncbi:hypothetical protein N9K40_04280 [Candidatus Pelagibacter sp.]|nr:hypothetical protein [Candidatus Pelagibacter sp.]
MILPVPGSRYANALLLKNRIKKNDVIRILFIAYFDVIFKFNIRHYSILFST